MELLKRLINLLSFRRFSNEENLLIAEKSVPNGTFPIADGVMLNVSRGLPKGKYLVTFRRLD